MYKNTSNLGVASIVALLVVHCFFTTFGFNDTYTILVQFIIMLFCIIYTRSFKFNRGLIIWVLPIIIIILNTKNYTLNTGVKYLLWMIVAVFAISMTTKATEYRSMIKMILIVSIILFLSIIIQQLFPAFFSVISRYMAFSDSFTYKYDLSHNIFYGIAVDKSCSNMVGILCISCMYYLGDLIGLSKKFKIIFGLMGFYICILSGSRSGLMELLLTIAVVEILKTEERKKAIKYLKIILSALAILVLLYFIYILFPNLRAIRRLFEAVSEVSTGQDISSGRNLLYLSAVRGFLNSPIFGNGWFQFNINNIGIIDSGVESYVHNILLQLLYDVGIFGTILFLLPFLYFLKKTIVLIRKNNKANITKNYPELLFSAFIQIFYLMDSLLHVGLLDGMILEIYFMGVLMYYVGKERSNRKQCMIHY